MTKNIKYRKVILPFFIISVFLISSCGDRSESSALLVKEGKRLQAFGKNEEAAEKFEQAIRKDKKNFDAWFHAGNSKMTVGKHQEAIEYLEKAVSIKEDYAPAWYSIGLAWFYLDDQEKACENWQKAESLGYPNISDRTRHCK